MNLELMVTAAVWSSIFASFGLYYVRYSIMVYDMTF